MDFASYSSVSSVSTQTPTEDRTFEFPECFSSSPPMTQSVVSSIGTQTELRRRLSYESSDSDSSPMVHSRTRLFRRHSTGSDVYNFSTSPMLTAFGSPAFGRKGFLGAQVLPEVDTSTQTLAEKMASGVRPTISLKNSDDVDVESVGKQLRSIADDLDRGGVGVFRSRSLSVSRFLVNVRRRTSSSSS